MEVQAITPVGQFKNGVVSSSVASSSGTNVGYRDAQTLSDLGGSQSSGESDDRYNGIVDLLEHCSESFNDARLVFRVDHDTGDLVIEIREYETGELIRQIPAEEFERMSKNIREYLGLLVDERR